MNQLSKFIFDEKAISRLIISALHISTHMDCVLIWGLHPLKNCDPRRSPIIGRSFCQLRFYLFLSPTASRITTHVSCHLATITQQLTYMHAKKEPENFCSF